MRSHSIKRKTAQTILQAFDFAKHIDRPLNQSVTIRMTGIPIEAGRETFETIRTRCYVWLKRKQKMTQGQAEAPYYTYAFENPDHADLHLHWVVHVPERYQTEFRRKLKRWVAKAFGRQPEQDEVHVRDVNPYEDKTLAKYILKGTDELYHNHFNLQKFATPGEDQGLVIGRRAGASHALNREARRSAGFIARQHRNEWKTREWAKNYRRPSYPKRSRQPVRSPISPGQPEQQPGQI